MTNLEYYLSSEAARLGADRDLRRSHSRGETVRIARGIYAPRESWEALDPDARYRLLTHAALSRYPAEQASHDSAAALWRLPSLGAWPARAHATVAENRSQRPAGPLTRHEWGLDPDAFVIEGLAVTSLPRTVVDMARSTSFVRAVGMADAALRGRVGDEVSWEPVDPSALQVHLARVSGRTGAARAARVLDFADARAESLGESLCRVQFHALGLPAPELQRVFVDRQGQIIPDFYFARWDLAVEFDGVGKYLRGRAFHPELSEADLVVREKRRENRLRRLVSNVMRVEWAEALDRRRLSALLREHSVVA